MDPTPSRADNPPKNVSEVKLPVSAHALRVRPLAFVLASLAFLVVVIRHDWTVRATPPPTLMFPGEHPPFDPGAVERLSSSVSLDVTEIDSEHLTGSNGDVQGAATMAQSKDLIRIAAGKGRRNPRWRFEVTLASCLHPPSAVADIEQEPTLDVVRGHSLHADWACQPTVHAELPTRASADVVPSGGDNKTGAPGQKPLPPRNGMPPLSAPRRARRGRRDKRYNDTCSSRAPLMDASPGRNRSFVWVNDDQWKEVNLLWRSHRRRQWRHAATYWDTVQAAAAAGAGFGARAAVDGIINNATTRKVWKSVNGSSSDDTELLVSAALIAPTCDPFAPRLAICVSGLLRKLRIAAPSHVSNLIHPHVRSTFRRPIGGSRLGHHRQRWGAEAHMKQRPQDRRCQDESQRALLRPMAHVYAATWPVPDDGGTTLEDGLYIVKELRSVYGEHLMAVRVDQPHPGRMFPSGVFRRGSTGLMLYGMEASFRLLLAQHPFVGAIEEAPPAPPPEVNDGPSRVLGFNPVMDSVWPSGIRPTDASTSPPMSSDESLKMTKRRRVPVRVAKSTLARGPPPARSLAEDRTWWLLDGLTRVRWATMGYYPARVSAAAGDPSGGELVDPKRTSDSLLHGQVVGARRLPPYDFVVRVRFDLTLMQPLRVAPLAHWQPLVASQNRRCERTSGCRTRVASPVLVAPKTSVVADADRLNRFWAFDVVNVDPMRWEVQILRDRYDAAARSHHPRAPRQVEGGVGQLESRPDTTTGGTAVSNGSAAITAESADAISDIDTTAAAAGAVPRDNGGGLPFYLWDQDAQHVKSRSLPLSANDVVMPDNTFCCHNDWFSIGPFWTMARVMFGYSMATGARIETARTQRGTLATGRNEGTFSRRLGDNSGSPNSTTPRPPRESYVDSSDGRDFNGSHSPSPVDDRPSGAATHSDSNSASTIAWPLGWGDPPGHGRCYSETCVGRLASLLDVKMRPASLYVRLAEAVGRRNNHRQGCPTECPYA